MTETGVHCSWRHVDQSGERRFGRGAFPNDLAALRIEAQTGENFHGGMEPNEMPSKNFRSTCGSCRAITVTSDAEWRPGRRRPRCSRCGASLETRGINAQRSGQSTNSGSEPLPPALQQQLAELSELRMESEPKGICIEACLSSNGLRFRFDHLSEVRGEFWPATGTLRLVSSDGGRFTTKATDVRDALNKVLNQLDPRKTAGIA